MIAFAEPLVPSSCKTAAASASCTRTDDFLRLLPAIRAHLRFAFRRFPAEAHEEATQEAISNAFVAYARLVSQGRSHVAAASPLARFAVAQVRSGRKVGGRINVRDIASLNCRLRKAVVLERLDHWDARRECWREALVEDGSCTPAELAGSRIDFEEWLKSLSSRNRAIALRLAAGEATSDVALEFGVSPGRISQLRSELHTSWNEFHQQIPKN